MTYKSFGTTEEFFLKLVQRFSIPDQLFESEKVIPIQLRVCNVLRHWIETQFFDFDAYLIDKLQKFCQIMLVNSSYTAIANTILNAIQRQVDAVTNLHDLLVDIRFEQKVPLAPAQLLFLFDEEELARQLTLVDFSVFRQIKPQELMNQAWNKAKLKWRAPNVLNMIARSTQLSMWISSQIMWQSSLKERVRALTKIVNIAEQLRRLNNFNSLVSVLAGINNAATHRLKFTKEDLPRRTQELLASMNTLMSSDQSFSTYRKSLHSIDPPCVPFLGVALTDLTFIDDGNPDMIGPNESLINFGKRELLYSVIGEIQQYQQTAYPFSVVDNIASCLNELPFNHNDDLFSLSLTYEPRNATRDQIAP